MVFWLAACGGENEVPPTAPPSFTPRPSASPTLRSTPLPTVATSVPLGVEERPLKIAFIAESTTAINRAIRSLTTNFTEEAANFSLGTYNGLQIEFILLNNQQEALNLLCNSNDTAVMVDIFTYLAAERACGAIPALQVEREDSAGSNFELVINTDRVLTLSNLLSSQRGNRFCVFSQASLPGFIHPALAFRALANTESLRNIGPKIDLLNADSIELVTTGFENDLEMVQLLQSRNRQCEITALPVGRFDEIVTELAAEDPPVELQRVALFNVEEQIDAADRWPAIPYEVLVFPAEDRYPTYLREEIVRIFTVLEEENGADKRSLNTLVEHDNLAPVTPESFADFRNWLIKAGWDMAALN